MAYDVFGNGKTSLKVNVGKYLEAATNHNTYSLSNPAARIAGSPVLGAPPPVTRAWTDSNGNYKPDCDLLNPNAQNLSASGGDICGVLSNLNFGKPVFTGSFDPEILEGWGVRPSDWQIGVSVQQELMTGVSVEVGYFRRWLQNFTVVDNLRGHGGDFDPFSVTAPVRSAIARRRRLRGVRGCTTSSNAKAGQTNSFTTWSNNFGSADVDVQRRAGERQRAHAERPDHPGRLNSGSTVTDNCEIRGELPEISPTNPFCRDDPGLVTRLTGLAAYTVPKIDVLVSGTFRSDQGTPLQANWVVSSAEAAKSLGRPLSGGAPNVTVNLIEPGRPVGRSRQRDRSSPGQDPALRPHAHQRRRGRLQPVQLERGAELQPGVQPCRHLAGADDGRGRDGSRRSALRSTFDIERHSFNC